MRPADLTLPDSHRPSRSAARPVLVACLLVAACRSERPDRDRAELSQELRTRTGHGLPSAAEVDLPLPAGVELADGLDQSEAVALALWKSPEFAAVLAELGVARGEVVEAGLLKDPILTFLFPLGPKQYEWTLLLPLEALWQRPRRIQIAELDLERTALDLVRHGLDLARDTSLAFVECVAAEERAAATLARVELVRELVRVADERVRAGEAEAAE
ncbi:MAG: TolC family protein, partial [Planctomycetes bacterium]|nr:TolC family protein [Planctomycetota bacterium]